MFFVFFFQNHGFFNSIKNRFIVSRSLMVNMIIFHNSYGSHYLEQHLHPAVCWILNIGAVSTPPISIVLIFNLTYKASYTDVNKTTFLHAFHIVIRFKYV